MEIRRRHPQIKGIDDVPSDSPAGQILESFFPVPGIHQAGMEETGSQIVGCHDFLCFLFPGDFLGRFVPFHHIGKHISPCAAAETVVQPSGRIHRKGRCLFSVKGTAAPVPAALPLQVHGFRDDAYDVRRLTHLLFEIGKFLFHIIHGTHPYSFLQYCIYSTKKKEFLLLQEFPLTDSIFRIHSQSVSADIPGSGWRFLRWPGWTH